MINQEPIWSVRQRTRQDIEEKQRKAGVRYSKRTKVYERYISGVDHVGAQAFPLETHQAVLRACTPQLGDIRAYTAQLLQKRKTTWHRLNHPYEYRFRRILKNIADAGFTPSREDFRFVMSQFAAVGHYTGIRECMDRMEGVGLELDRGTFELLLQAIAHRASLPASALARSAIVRRLVAVATQVLREMNDRQIPPSPKSLDLSLRILSEVYDLEGLTRLLRVGYGVDLNYLDSPPMNAISAPSTSAGKPSSFSTTTLNSLMETLGRWGQISKMVYAFETLTKPLPAPAKTDDKFEDEDEDEDDFSPIQQEWKPPFAEPNTTTFNTLIKYCVIHKQPVLARHYASQLMHEELMSTYWLWRKLKVTPANEVAAPRLAVTTATLRPIHGLASRTNNVWLMKWVIRACRLSMRRKWRAYARYNYMMSKFPSPPSSPPSRSKSPPSRTFNVVTHIWLLRSELTKLFHLRWISRKRLWGLIEKKKSWLGRRIWNSKDVYMADKGARVKIEPEVWKGVVNFRERRRWKVKSREAGKLLKEVSNLVADTAPPKP